MSDIWIDLGEPTPRKVQKNYTPYVWSSGRKRYFRIFDKSMHSKIEDVLLRRRSRLPTGQANLNTVGALLQGTSQVLFTGKLENGLPFTQRPVPSAGGIHPIWILINEPGESNWWRYIPEDHLLEEVENPILDGIKIRELIKEAVPSQNATLIQFIAEPGKTNAKYEAPCSLIWRDAGVLLAYFAIVAEALEMAFLPLGVSGHDWVRYLTENNQLVGVGMAAIGTSARS